MRKATNTVSDAKLETIGRTSVSTIPQELQHPDKVLDDKGASNTPAKQAVKKPEVMPYDEIENYDKWITQGVR